MAITKAAKKANRAALRRRVFNQRRKKALHDSVKEVQKMAGKVDQKALSTAFKAIDKAAKRGVISKNAASRKKSRLTRVSK